MPRKVSRRASSSSSEDFYEVEHIVGKRTSPSGAVEYEVKWKGFPASQNTWEPLASLSLAQEAIAAFEARHADQTSSAGREENNAEEQGGGGEEPQEAQPSKCPKTAGATLKRLTKKPPRTPPAPRHFDEDFVVDDDDAPQRRPTQRSIKREDVSVASVKEVNGNLVWTAVLKDGTTTLDMTVEQLKRRAPLALIDYLVSKLRFA